MSNFAYNSTEAKMSIVRKAEVASELILVQIDALDQIVKDASPVS